MKYRFTVACLSLILLAALSVVSYGGAKEGQAKAVVSNNVFEFQPVLEGTQVTHDFIIQNQGNVTLGIEKIVSG